MHASLTEKNRNLTLFDAKKVYMENLKNLDENQFRIEVQSEAPGNAPKTLPDLLLPWFYDTKAEMCTLN